MKISNQLGTALLTAVAVTVPRAGHAAPSVADLEFALQSNAASIFDYAGRPSMDAIDRCLDAYDKLHAAGVADTDTVTVAYDRDKNPLTKGTYAISYVHDYCAKQKVAAAQLAAANDAKQKLGGAVASLLQQVKGLDDGTIHDFKQIDSFIKDCDDAVDAAHAAGIADDLALDVPSNGESYAWKGTLGTMKKEVCDRGDAARKQALDKLSAPYVKAGMKNDKLKMIIDNAGATYFQVVGGETTLDAKKLMASKVWFEEFAGGGGTCASDEPGYLTRFQFDRDQKLVKTTSKDYCGTPPKAAFR